LAPMAVNKHQLLYLFDVASPASVRDPNHAAA
jgi:hypothetical protein